MSTEIAKKPLRQVANVRELLVNDMAKQQLATVAAKHMRPERMMRILANAMRTTPQLAECEPLSLLGAMMTSASLGLEPQTPLAHAYLIPFKNRRKGVTEVQFIIGWRGMIALARRSGAVVNIHADVVYQNDEFSFEYGSDQHLRHKPSGERENPQYAYCYAKLTDGEAFIVLPWPEIIKTRDNSQGYQTAKRYGKLDETPWVKHVHAMAKKTAVRRLFDELPISIEEVSEAVGVDEQRNDFTSFALNPEHGITINGEFTEEDAAPEDEGDAQAQDSKSAADPEPDPKADAKKEAKPKATAKPEPKAEDKPEPKEDDEATKRHRATLNKVEDDLADGAPASGTRQFHAESLDLMKAEAPDLFAQVDAMLNHAEATG